MYNETLIIGTNSKRKYQLGLEKLQPYIKSYSV